MLRDAFGYIDVDDLDSVPTPSYLDEILNESNLNRAANKRKLGLTKRTETE